MQVMQRLSEKDFRRALEIHVDDRTRLVTGELSTYKPIGVRFSGGHHTVTYSAKEYVNKENPEIHSNTSESVFAIVNEEVGLWNIPQRQQETLASVSVGDRVPLEQPQHERCSTNGCGGEAG